MGAETAGRKLGIGLRLAARAAQQRAAEVAAPAPTKSATSPSTAQAVYGNSSARNPSATAVQAAKQVKSKAGDFNRGAKRFGEALWGPMAHTGGVLWLEITGLFFALFAIFFAQNVYRFRHSYAVGPEHAHFLVYAALTLLFTVFTVSQFYKARRKEKKNRARQTAAARP